MCRVISKITSVRYALYLHPPLAHLEQRASLEFQISCVSRRNPSQSMLEHPWTKATPNGDAVGETIEPLSSGKEGEGRDERQKGASRRKGGKKCVTSLYVCEFFLCEFHCCRAIRRGTSKCTMEYHKRSALKSFLSCHRFRVSRDAGCSVDGIPLVFRECHLCNWQQEFCFSQNSFFEVDEVASGILI